MTQLLLETATDVCSVAVARDGALLAERTATEGYRHASHLTVFIREALEAAGLTLAEVDEVVLSDGPGSYTSLRVGAATAKGLCVALPELRLRAVPTLLSLAGASEGDGIVLAVINSRRGEVYGQVFRKSYSENAAGVLIVDDRVSAFKAATPRGEGGDTEEGEEVWWWMEKLTEPMNLRFADAGWFDEVVRLAGGKPITVVGPGQERLLSALTSQGMETEVGGAAPYHCSASHLLAPATAPLSLLTGENAARNIAEVAAYEPFYLNPPFVTKSTKKPLA